MKALFVAAALLAAGALAPRTAHADAVTAEWSIDTAGSTFGGFGLTGITLWRGQEFLATTAGKVTSIALRVARDFDHGDAFRVRIYEADVDSRPLGDPLVSHDFPAEAIPVNEYAVTVLDFTGDGPILEAGKHYVLAFTANPPSESGASYSINGAGSGNATYTDGNTLFGDGTTWNVSTITDWCFRVTVDETVPVQDVSWGEVKLGAGAP